MQTQNNAQIECGDSPFIKLLIGWFIIIFSYIMLRIVFLMFGFISKLALGGCLAIIPYLFGALYFRKSCGFKGAWFYTFGILFPAIVEKFLLYLLGAFLYDISPTKITNVLEAISSHEPYVNFLKNPAAPDFLNISFFGWAYVLVSVALSVLLILLLANNRRRKTQG